MAAPLVRGEGANPGGRQSARGDIPFVRRDRGGADLASGGAEGARQTSKARSAVAQK